MRLATIAGRVSVVAISVTASTVPDMKLGLFALIPDIVHSIVGLATVKGPGKDVLCRVIVALGKLRRFASPISAQAMVTARSSAVTPVAPAVLASFTHLFLGNWIYADFSVLQACIARGQVTVAAAVLGTSMQFCRCICSV